jgi:hypothetical protein
MCVWTHSYEGELLGRVAHFFFVTIEQMKNCGCYVVEVGQLRRVKQHLQT